jgi:hypothetical protein
MFSRAKLVACGKNEESQNTRNEYAHMVPKYRIFANILKTYASPAGAAVGHPVMTILVLAIGIQMFPF